MAELLLAMDLKTQMRREALAAGVHEAKATVAATNPATKRRPHKPTKFGLEITIRTPQYKTDPANHAGSVVGEGATRQAKLLPVLLVMLLQLLSAAVAEMAVLTVAFTSAAKSTLRLRWEHMVALRL